MAKPTYHTHGPSITLMGISGVGKSRATGKIMAMQPDIRRRSIDESIWLPRAKGPQTPLREAFEAWACEYNKDISTIGARNLGVTAKFLGMLGDPAHGGVDEETFRRHMALHAEAEHNVLANLHNELKSGQAAIDMGGSAIHVLDEDIKTTIRNKTQTLLIQASLDHLKNLEERNRISPKPLYYPSEFLDEWLPKLCVEYGVGNADMLAPEIVSDFLYPHLMQERLDDYMTLAQSFGTHALILPMNEARQLNGQGLWERLTA